MDISRIFPTFLVGSHVFGFIRVMISLDLYGPVEMPGMYRSLA